MAPGPTSNDHMIDGRTLIIDTRNGIAGDITCAGLISLGADPTRVADAMERAGSYIGTASVVPMFNKGIVSLDICLSPSSPHLQESEARGFLSDILSDLDLSPFHRLIGMRILDTLCEAERFVHSSDRRLQHMHRSPPNGFSNKHHPPQAILHESQDILCDITGFVVGLSDLDIRSVRYVQGVTVGNGSLTFSHGTFEVPAPATRRILDTHGIPWSLSEEKVGEMATPTGVSILVGSGAELTEEIATEKSTRTGFASGTRPGLSPVSFHLKDIQ